MNPLYVTPFAILIPWGAFLTPLNLTAGIIGYGVQVAGLLVVVVLNLSGGQPNLKGGKHYGPR